MPASTTIRMSARPGSTQVTATAGVAAVTGAAQSASTSVKPGPGVVAVTGSAGAAKAAVQPKGGLVSVTGSSYIAGTSGSYDAVFSGDATGSSNVSAALASFVSSNPGKRLAMAVNGVYRLDNVTQFTGNGWTLDWRGSRFVSNVVNNYTILLQSNQNVTLNDIKGTGRGYAYDEVSQADRGPSNNEHLLAMQGVANVTINRPVLDHSYGDAIYARDFSTGIVCNNVDLSYCGRNAISPVSAGLSVYGGTIHHILQYGIDYEPNNASDVPYCKGTLSGITFSVIGDSSASGWSTLYNAGYSPGICIASATEYAAASRGPFTVTGCSADVFWVYFYGQTNLTITNNTSTLASSGTKNAWVQEKSCTGTTYSGQSGNITRLQW